MKFLGLFGAIVLMSLSALFFHPASDDLWVALALLVGGVLALGAALWGRAGIPHAIPQQTAQAVKVRWLWVLVGVVLLAIVAEDNSFVLRRIVTGAYPDLENPYALLNIHLQMLLLLGGMALVIAGLFGLRRHDLVQIWRDIRQSRDVLPLLLIVLLALVLRVTDIENTIHDFVDEVHLVTAMNALRTDPFTPMLTPFDDVAQFTWFYPYGHMLFSDVLGNNFTGLRMQSVIFGTLTVLAMYLLARQLFDRRVALVAALLLATFPPHIHFSRLSLLLIATPPIGMLALVALLQGMKTDAKRYFALSGAILGILAYYDEGSELLFPLLIVVWLVWLRLHGKRTPSWRQVGWLILGFVLVSFPAYLTLYGYGALFLPRMAQNDTYGEFSMQDFLLNDGFETLFAFLDIRILPPFLHYVHLPDSSGFYYGGVYGLVLPPLVPLFLLGIAHCLWRPGTVGMLLLVWVAGGALGNSLLSEPTWSARYMPVAPALVLLMAAGLCYTGRLLLDYVRWQALRRYAVPVLALLFAAGQMGYYVFDHIPHIYRTLPIWPSFEDTAFRAALLPEDTVIYAIYGDVFVGVYVDDLLFWLGEPRDFTARPANMTHMRFLAALPPAHDYAFFVDRRDFRTPAMLRRLWDVEGPLFSPYNINQQRQYALYLAPAAARQIPAPP